MTNGVIRVALERDVRIGSLHPHIERIMQEQICQDGTDNPALRSSRCPQHDAAIFQLNRSPQPALDIEQNPRTARMMTNRPEHQLPINAVEIGFYVEVEHPVTPPAALPDDSRFQSS